MEYNTQQTPAAQAGEIGKKAIARGAPDLNAGATAREGFRMAQEAVRPGQGMANGPETEATAEEQQEYDYAVSVLGKVLYENENTSEAITKQLQPQEKVGSVAKASMLVIKQIDEKIDLDEVIIPEFTQDVVDRMIDMYENLHGDEFSEQEAQGALGSAWEGVMELFGIDEDSYAELTAGMSDDEFAGYEAQQKQFLGEG
jgi:hypothetical protein